MLPRFSKLLERIVYNRIYKFLVDHDILDENHFGFQAAYSTEHAILQLRSHIADSCKSGKFTLGIFTDFSKPFGTVDDSILIKKLEKYGIKNQNLNWFKSYLILKSDSHPPKKFVLFA